MRRTGFLVLTSLTGVAAFSSSVQPGSSTFRSPPRCFDMSLAAVDAAAWSAIVVAASAAATYQEYRTDKFETLKDIYGWDHLPFEKNGKSAPDPAATVVVEETVPEKAAPVKKTVAVEAPKPAPVVKPKPVVAAKEKVASTPAPQKKVAVKKNPVPATPKPKAVTMATKSEPAVVKEPEPRTASDDLTDLVKKVGKTVEQNKEMEDRVKARRQKETEEMQAEDSDLEVATAVLTKEKTTKKRGLVRKAWRVTKKVVAPWRKWDNIS